MAILRLKANIELEAEDVSDETLRTIEIQCARLAEVWEAQLVLGIKESVPGLNHPEWVR